MDSSLDDKLSEQIFNKLEEYMFTRGNMAKYNKVFSAMIVEKIKEEKRNKLEEIDQEQDLEQAQQTQVQKWWWKTCGRPS